MLADGGCNLLRVAASGNDGVARGQGRLGEVNAKAAACAGDQPYLLVRHLVLLFSSLPMGVTLGRVIEKKNGLTLNAV